MSEYENGSVDHYRTEHGIPSERWMCAKIREQSKHDALPEVSQLTEYDGDPPGMLESISIALIDRVSDNMIRFYVAALTAVAILALGVIYGRL